MTIRNQMGEAGRAVEMARKGHNLLKMAKEIHLENRKTIIYALGSDPDFMAFDLELMSCDRLEAAEHYEYVPCACVSGIKVYQTLIEGKWVASPFGNEAKKFTAQQIFWGEAEQYQVYARRL